MSVEALITDHLDLWSGAAMKKSSSGRGGNNKIELTGVKKLRGLILSLAVRGKLVPQKSEEPSAASLLADIEAKKKELHHSKIAKKPKQLSRPQKDEAPCTIPSCWEWVKLPDIYYSISPSGKKLKSSETRGNGKFPVVDQGKSYVSGYTDDESLVIDIPHPVIVFGDHTTARKYIDFNFVPGADGTKILCPILINPRFFYLQTLGYDLENRGYARHFKVLNENFFALPPLNEQHRIVQKVDELMALCDQLEQQTSDQIAAHGTLVDTLLGTLTQSQNATELAENWIRLAAHFDTLFTTEKSIDKLKQTILELGITGKFKASIAPRNVQKSGMERSSSKDSKAGAIPTHWNWTSIAEVATEFQNGASSRGDKEGQDIIVLRLADIENGEIKIKEPRRLKIGNKSIKKYRLNKGDLLIIRVNGSADLVGRFIHVQDNNEAIYCDHFIRMRIDESLVNPDYLTMVGSSKIVRSRIEDLFVSTAGQKTVNQKHINSLKIPLPPIEEQRSIMEEVARLFSMCDGLALKVRNAAETQLHLAETLSSPAISG